MTQGLEMEQAVLKGKYKVKGNKKGNYKQQKKVSKQNLYSANIYHVSKAH